jgi:hypothetical protein
MIPTPDLIDVVGASGAVIRRYFEAGLDPDDKDDRRPL